MSQPSGLRKKAPYAPAASVIAAIKRYRERGLPEPVDKNALESIGITPGVAALTLATLKFLGLINADGFHSERFDQLRRATSENYPSELLQVIQNAYTDVFVIVDPIQDSRDRITDAFRQYDPQAQRERMVALFIGLCREAGLIIMGANSPRLEKKNNVERQIKPRTVAPKKPTPEVGSLFSQTETSPLQAIEIERIESRVSFDLITALIRQLPPKGTWTSAQRQRWINALQANIDLVIEVTDEQLQ